VQQKVKVKREQVQLNIWACVGPTRRSGSAQSFGRCDRSSLV